MTQQPPLPAGVQTATTPRAAAAVIFDDAFVSARCLQNIIESIVFGWRAIDMARHTFIFIVFVYKQ